jgi:NADP-reducing hydrogenase subunit HndC
MAKLTVESLVEYRKDLNSKTEAFAKNKGREVMVCGGTGCESNKGDELYQNLISESDKAGISSKVDIKKTGCMGFCEKGPIVKVFPENSFYVDLTPDHAEEIVKEHLVDGCECRRLMLDGEESESTDFEENDFFKKQVRIVLRNSGEIDPENIDEYIARDGYAALAKVLTEMDADGVLAELEKSGLRGRGGAGFPTHLKWKFSKDYSSDQKYVICNADEGDPGAYMDRSTLEGDPHSVLEAMAIAGYTVGADTGYIYIRAEYPLAIDRLNLAIDQARKLGLLGKGVMGTDFNFDIELRLGAGAFVCGEETALIQSIEGSRGMPTTRPPFPATHGLWQKPTVINNVETWANICPIILKGGDWYSSIGTETSKGTKVFALTGKVQNSGLVEVPMGLTLREIIFEIGGGIKDGKAFKAVQTGGPSGGTLTPEFLDTPIDFEHLRELGSIMGSGGMIVMDEDDCMVDVAKFYLEFTVDESCGKCAPCRIGGRQLYDTLDRLTKGKGVLEDIANMKKIGAAMQKASLCGLGQTAPNPVLSALNTFEEEYMEHIDKKFCLAGKCKDLMRYTIIEDKCIGCTLCARKCPVNCISGERKQPHLIDQDACIKCGECFNACKFDAVAVG